jgi:hypothetical protein
MSLIVAALTAIEPQEPEERFGYREFAKEYGCNRKPCKKAPGRRSFMQQ